MTEKYTKNILTRESIEKELIKENRTNIRTWCINIIASVILLFALSWTVYLAFVTVGNILMKWICCIILGGGSATPTIIAFTKLYKSIKQKNMLRESEFNIVVERLQYKSDSVSIRDRRRIPRIEGYLHFEGFNAYLVNSTEYQLASMGDDYYIVHYKNSKNIEMLFPTKMYEYKEV
ncbi:MAG: hypothetical protein E7613_01710 [Ruminococcaceae bacterium]|nr:hypothetical protein [Oscillospiraceae bacterium]